MALQIMYPGMVNSPETTITNNISESDTIIYVLDPARVPEPPNLMTLGTGTNAETVKVLEMNDNAITVERGFQGVAKSWPAGTVIARNFTEYDYNALRENIEDLEATKETPQGAQEKADAALNSAKQYTDQEVGEVAQELAAHLADGVHQKVEVNNTNDATSATNAPLKTAGGLAVAKNAIFGQHIQVGVNSNFLAQQLGNIGAKKTWIFTTSSNLTNNNRIRIRYQVGNIRRLIYLKIIYLGSNVTSDLSENHAYIEKSCTFFINNNQVFEAFNESNVVNHNMTDKVIIQPTGSNNMFDIIIMKPDVANQFSHSTVVIESTQILNPVELIEAVVEDIS